MSQNLLILFFSLNIFSFSIQEEFLYKLKLRKSVTLFGDQEKVDCSLRVEVVEGQALGKLVRMLKKIKRERRKILKELGTWSSS